MKNVLYKMTSFAATSNLLLHVLFIVSFGTHNDHFGYVQASSEDRVDNSFQHNVDYLFDESGERFKLRSSGRLSNVIDLDNLEGIKRLLCVDNKILLALQNDDVVSSWKPGQILLGSAKWDCNSSSSSKESGRGIYSKITKIYFPTKRRVSIHFEQAGPFDMIEEANIHFHYTAAGNKERETILTRKRRRIGLSNILTSFLRNIDWKVNISPIIPFNQDEELDIPKRYFVLHKSLGDRQLTYSEYPTDEQLQNVTDDFTFKCLRCHGISRISYIFELRIKKVNNKPQFLKFISQLQSESHLIGDIETTFSKEMALTYNQDLWSTKPTTLMQIPVAAVRCLPERVCLPPIVLTISYTTHTAASIKGYVGGKSKIRTSYMSGGNFVISQKFEKGTDQAGDASAYRWNVTNGEHTDISSKYAVSLTFDIHQRVLFIPSVSWHEKDITLDLAPPMEMTLRPSVHVLSQVRGHSQCIGSKVNVTGNFHISKAELKVTAFGLSIWDVFLRPKLSKALTMTAQTVHENCAAYCQGQVQLGPPKTAESVCGRISRRITRQDPRFHQELRCLHGNLMLFLSEENSTRCEEPGKTCLRCRDKAFNVLKNCSNRLVSARMATPLSKLGKLVQAEWKEECLQVLDAWKELSSEHHDGQHKLSSLHYEGRAAIVAVSFPDYIERLAELAVCSGFDYVRILKEADKIMVAVKTNGKDIRGENRDDLLKQMFDEAMNTQDIDQETTTCLKSAPFMKVGDTYPEGQDNEIEMCSPLQRELYRENQRDMKRLYYYVFEDVEFMAEAGGRWCGVETRLCKSCDPISSSESWDWCSTRMMTPQLAIALRTMAKTASADGIEIKVLGSYQEEKEQKNSPRERSVLYHEGRGIMLTTKTGKDIKKLVRHAICAGIDFVRYTNEFYIEGFVLPQSDYQAKFVHFIDGPIHLEVNPPRTLDAEYKYPVHLNEEDVKPLLVDAHYDQHEVSEHYTFADIKDPGKRYLRFDPSLLECLELASDDLDMVIEIIHGSAYRTRSSNQNNLDMRHVEEMWRFQAGQAVEIKTGKLNSDQRLVELAKSILRSCTTFLRLDLRGIGIGCHHDRLYLDIRPLADGKEMDFITLWDVDGTTYCNKINQLKDALLKGGPAISPFDVSTTCRNIPVGEDMKYITFQFHQTELCNVEVRDAFCKKSKSARKKEILKLQERMTDTAGFGRLPRHDILPEIEACLLDLCGGCPGAGDLWDRKVKACAYMVHKYLHKAARPFPELKNKASFFNTASPVSAVHSLACHDDNVCVESVQLYSIFMPLVTSRFQPNKYMSQEYMLFSSEKNPIPILELVEQEMAYKASGKVKVFIEKDKDVSSLRHILKVLMAYNQNVTEVEFHVADDLDVDLVGAAIQRKIDLWAKNTCPKWSRFAIAPYKLLTIPPSRKKRSLERSKERNRSTSKIHNWEMEWLMKLI